MPDGVVALARCGLETWPVGNMHPTPRVVDQPRLLQHAGSNRHPGSAYAEHQREELVRHDELVRVGPVMRNQQPAGEAVLNRMARVAGSGQRHLRMEGQGVAQQERAQFGAR